MSLVSTAHFIQRASSKFGLFHKNVMLSRLNRSFSTSSTIYQSTKNVNYSGSYSKSKKYLKILGIGCGLGAMFGGAQMFDKYYYSDQKVETILTNPATARDYLLDDQPPKQKLARSIRTPADGSGLKITLYQFQTCPFCCKVRAFLDYYGFSYDVVEVNSVTRAQTKWSKYRKVPFLVIEQENVDQALQLKDSTMIISTLQSFILNKKETLDNLTKCYPIIHSIDESGKKVENIMNRYSLMYGYETTETKQKQLIEEKKWRMWADDVYVHVLSPNVYRTMNESFQAFHWFSKIGNWEELFASWERQLVIYVGSVAMYVIGKRLKKRHNLKDDVRQSFYDETVTWLRQIEKSSVRRKFHGGDEPDLADLSIYGVLTAVEGCDAFQDVLDHTKVSPWFMDMKAAVTCHSGAKHLQERGPNRPGPVDTLLS